MLRTSGRGTVRVLDGRDLAAARALMARDPVMSVFIASRTRVAGLDPWRLGGELWGHEVDGELRALCYSGANLVPYGEDPGAALAFAERARRAGRRCSSIVGPAALVAPMWRELEPAWGPARDVRPRQPVMVTEAPSTYVAADPRVRRATPDDLPLVLPACVAMFTEEVGVSPLGYDGGAMYRARVTELVRAGRSFVRIEDGRVVFKAEIGAVSDQACQVQGVWVTPERRGEGLCGPGMAAVVEIALRELAPLVSLYVNDFNAAARACYRRVGFGDAGTFMSVFF